MGSVRIDRQLLMFVLVILVLAPGCGSSTALPTGSVPAESTTRPIPLPSETTSAVANASPTPPASSSAPTTSGADSTALATEQTESGVYYVDPHGNDANPGTEARPWQTIQRAVRTITAGDTVYIRGGEYEAPLDGFVFQNSGTESRPITLTNYPGEQVIFRIPGKDTNYAAFRCWTAPDWLTPKAEYIRIVGTDVDPTWLSNGVQSHRGIVVLGPDGRHTLGHGLRVAGCSYWEVAGIDFVDVGYAIFAYKLNNRTMEVRSTTNWYVHDNRVYGFYGESGMQFNGDYNRIEDNEVYKINDEAYNSSGCQAINILGNHNTVKGNRLSKLGSQQGCKGILLEWDVADYNLIEQNRIWDNDVGIYIAGGDHNVLRNNLIYRTVAPSQDSVGISINSYDDRATWPCDEPTVILPADNPVHPDYPYYFTPRNCHSFGNRVYNNVIDQYAIGVKFFALVPEDTAVRNNAVASWSVGSICHYNDDRQSCDPLPDNLVADHNVDQGEFGFVDLAAHDYHLAPNSPLIAAGYDLGSQVPDDFDGAPRPQGSPYDIGAYQHQAPSS